MAEALSDWGSSPWVLAPAALVLWIAVLLVVKKIGLGALRRVASRTRWTWDDVLVQSLSTPLLIAILASGLLVFDRILPLQPEWDRAFDVLFAFAIVLALVLFVDRCTRGALERLAAGSPVMQGARGLVQAAVRGLIIGIGLLIFLDSIGISITPILASLGVGSLAVALALQDTLANLFAGVYILADKPIEPGHLVKLPTGEEGHVMRVGWRSTWIRLVNNSTLVIPNSRLAGGTIVNFDLFDREIAVTVQAGVHFESDLDKVERVTLEVARDVLRTVAGAAPGFEPVLLFQGFGQSAVEVLVVLRAREYAAGPKVRHELVKRLVARYRQEGIVMPYPIRTIDMPPASPPEKPAGFTRPGGVT